MILPILKLVVSKRMPLAGVDVSEYDSEINKAVKEGHKVSVLAGAYLHGEVESFFGYDITVCLNAEECIDFDKKEYKEGIYPVDIIDYHSYLGDNNNYCKAYLWNSNGQPRGLIVDQYDEDACEYALRCFKNKVNAL